MISKLPLYLQVGRDLLKAWDSIASEDRDRLDAVLRQAAKVLIPDTEDLSTVRNFLTEGSEPFPIRIAGAFTDKRFRAFLSQQAGGRVDASDASSEERSMFLTRCRFCGKTQDVYLTPNSQPING